jgi:hypothetical protein
MSSYAKERKNLLDFNTSGPRDHAPSTLAKRYPTIRIIYHHHHLDTFRNNNQLPPVDCLCWFDGHNNEWCRGITKDNRVLWMSFTDIDHRHMCYCANCACCS